MHTGVFFDVPFDENGKHNGFISIPFSTDRSPYYQIKIPVCRIKNGPGKRLLLLAGNHGDEYEGELCLSKLVRLLDQADIQGEITIIPFLNMPAVMAARRCSPMDHDNLNRCFPGDPAGTPTRRLAHFLEHDLFPRHDVVFDIHSGGTTMSHLPTVLAEEQPDSQAMQTVKGLLASMGLKYGFIARNGADAPTSMAAAARAGTIGLSGEFGGGGSVSTATMATLECALDNLLGALDLTARKMFGRGPTHYMGPLQLLSLTSHEQAVYATRRGWFEPAAEVGDSVESGDTAGWFHDFQDIAAPQKALEFKASGIVISRRLNVDCEPGDCLIQVGVPA
jgi:predicted deacylase